MMTGMEGFLKVNITSFFNACFDSLNVLAENSFLKACDMLELLSGGIFSLRFSVIICTYSSSRVQQLGIAPPPFLGLGFPPENTTGQYYAF